MTRRRTCLLVVVFAGVLLVVLCAQCNRVLPLAVRFLDVGQPPHRAEYVMVLNGDLDVRPFVAAALVQAGWAPRVLVAGVETSPNVADGIIPPYHELGRQVLLHRGVSAQNILILDGQARTTFDEAKALAHFLESAPPARVLVVTNGYHTRRARLAFACALGERSGQVSFFRTGR